MTTADLAWLALVPRDTVFIRDGRAFDAVADTSATTVRPGPSTIAGAVGAAFGARPGAPRDALPAEVRGPVLARRAASGWEPFFPVPADVVQEAEGPRPFAFRLRPAAGEVVNDLDEEKLRGLAPPPGSGAVTPARGWVPREWLTRYLSGEVPDPDRGSLVRDLGLEAPLWDEPRVGLARTAGREARAGYLYQATHLRPEEGWGFLAGYLARPRWKRVAGGPVQLGGRGRLADVEPAATAGWPVRPESFPGGRVLAYLATPGLWPGGWRIPLPGGVSVVAAATGEPEPVATITPGPDWKPSRALRWAVPAGSVYLLRFPGEQQAARWAAGVHGTAWGRGEDDMLRTAGFGIVLTGVWT